MNFDITILTKKVEKLKQSFDSGKFADALVGAMNSGNGMMQNRIFGDNQDIKGNSFGVYVGKTHRAKLLKSKNRTQNKRLKAIAGLELTSYQRKRAKSGRQIAVKDLELTGGLRKSIETVIENEKSVILAFNNDQAAKIARGQENQITNIRAGKTGITKGNGIKIFTFNEKEKENVGDQGKKLILEILK